MSFGSFGSAGSRKSSWKNQGQPMAPVQRGSGGSEQVGSRAGSEENVMPPLMDATPPHIYEPVPVGLHDDFDEVQVQTVGVMEQALSNQVNAMRMNANLSGSVHEPIIQF